MGSLFRRFRPTSDNFNASVGAPLGSAAAEGPVPALEEVVAEALSLSHRDATVARVLPLVRWRQRDRLDLDRLRQEATRRDEGQALGYLLELAGRLGNAPRLVDASPDEHGPRQLPIDVRQVREAMMRTTGVEPAASPRV